MATLKTLAIDLELRRAGFTGQLDQSVGELDRLQQAAESSGEVVFGFSDDINNVADEVAGAAPDFGKLSRGVLELGRGAEDAAMGWSTGGLNGMIRGASNNVAQFLTVLSPLAGGLGALALAGVTVAVSMMNTKESTAEANTELEKHLDLLQRTGLAAKEQVEFEQQLRDLSSSEDADQLVQDQTDQLAALSAEQDEYSSAVHATEMRLAELRAELQHMEDLFPDSAPIQLGRFEIPMPGFLASGNLPSKDALRDEIATLAAQLPEEKQLFQDITAQIMEIEQQRWQAVDRFHELTDNEQQAEIDAAFGERLQGFGAALNELPELVAPVVLNLDAAEQQLREFDERMQADLAAREASELQHLQRIADGPAQLSQNIQRGSAEAFRTILQQQAERPNQRLESISTEQLAELRGMRADQERSRRTILDRLDVEIELL